METITTNNGMSTEEFKTFCMNYQSKMTQKEIDFLDFTCFILDTAVHSEEDMGFLLESEYHNGNFDNGVYETGEECWSMLFKLIGRDYEQMEEDFKAVKWEDNFNTAIVSFINDDKEYAILRM